MNSNTNQFHKIIKSILLIAFLSFFGFYAMGQAPTEFRALNWSVKTGLSQAEIYHIIKDKNGFIWLSSNDGLNRFDGYTIRNYFEGTDKKKSIVGDALNGGGFVEDSLHNIWMGTNKGLSRYDIKADTFTHFLPTGPLKENYITASPFWATKNEIFYIEVERVIYAYDIKTFKKRELGKYIDGDTVSMGPSLSYSMYDASSNSIWTLAGMGTITSGLLKYSLRDGKKTRFSWPCVKNIPGHDHTSEAMRYDPKRNSIWINSHDGLIEFNMKDEKFHPVEAMRDIFMLKDYSRWVGLDIDTMGRIWFTTSPKGMIIYDPSKNEVLFPFPKDSVVQKDIAFENAVVYCDRDGLIWSGFWHQKGFYQITPFSPSVKTYTEDHSNPDALQDFRLNSVKQLDSSNLMLGASGGMHIFNTKTETFRKFIDKDNPDTKNNPSQRPFAFIFGVKKTLDKAWLFNGDIFELDLKTWHRRPVIFLDKNLQAIEEGFCIGREYSGGLLFLSNSNNKQLAFFLNADSIIAKEVIEFKGEEVNPFFFVTAGNRSVHFKRRNGSGFITFIQKGEQFTRVSNILDSLNGSSLFYSTTDSSYWIAAERQLMHFDHAFKLIRSYGKEDGLPEISISAIIQDNNRNIWFHTDRSIHTLNPETGKISVLSEKDGFKPQGFDMFNNNFKDIYGDIYFPGGEQGKGLTRIQPDKYSTAPPSSIYIRSISINHENLVVDSGINILKSLSLPYDQNSITIETGIIDYYSKGESNIRFKLSGIDSSWQYGNYYYTIRYEGLTPGNYRLDIQASNASNEYNGITKTIQFQIRPAFWNTWWFRLLAVAMAIFLLYSFIQYRSQSLKERNQELEGKVMHRTKELKHSLEELRETQAQLIQREKMASLGELTAGIAHEIQNPLNFVNNFSDINTELIEEMKEEIKGGHSEEALSLTENISQNMEKIRFHGQRADNIVKGMLQHSRMNSGLKEPTDINALADEFLRLSYHGLRAKDKSFNASIETFFDPSIGKINVISQDIGRVLLNLFNNAFYAVSAKTSSKSDNEYHPKVTVTTKLSRIKNPSIAEDGNPESGIRNSEYISISVADNGLGISQKLLDKIFQPFFTTKPTGEGTGLGLSMSYEIITKGHGGELKVNTKEGEFAEFVITLPIS